ncbi:MAG: hypothetical protein HY914_17720 [Desulfomonile tiedjei]|nr:hypothetical protein [Desulfomonile tiedjei]
MDDHTILASEDNFGNVSVCPGGVVHVNLMHVSLKFLPQDFVRLCDLVAKAKQNLDTPRTPGGKPRLHLVPSETEDDKTPDPAP